MLKDCVFGLNLLSEYIFKLKELVSGTESGILKLAFNSVRGIISTLLEMGNLKKGCLRLNFFVGFLHESTLKLRKTKTRWYTKADYIEIDNGLLSWHRILQKSTKIL